MKKYKFFINYDHEEKWLETMTNQGFRLNNVSLGYNFYRAVPKKCVIKIDYRQFKNIQDFVDYLTLFEDSGWKHVAGTRYSGSHYFEKMHEGSSDDIFSDVHSRAGRYKRVSNMWVSLFIFYLPFVVAFLFSGTIKAEVILNPKLLYYTPGLWEMEGFGFWRSFL